MNLGWYMQRLRKMTPGELPHRALEQIRIARMRVAQGAHTLPTTSYRFCTSPGSLLPGLTWEDERLLESRMHLLRGEWHALGYSWKWCDQAGSWHRAPDTGKHWPRVFFADIDHREGNATGDARVVWEPARLQQLLPIARLSEISAGAAPGAAITSQFLSWVADNPPYIGIHYVSAMECALRLIAVLHAFDVARAYIATAAWQALPGFVSSHAKLIEQRLSLHSSSGNHTIAEATALMYVGLLFPELPRAKAWLRTGEALIEREGVRQILTDGGGIERSLGYLAMIVELGSMAGTLLQSIKGRRLAIWPRLDLGRRFLATFGSDADAPQVNDDDGGRALSDYCRVPSRRLERREGLTVFERTGFAVYHRRRDRVRLTFDHGPLGMAPAFGHAHADTLSVTLSVDGRALLVDPGTFCYTGDATWRRYFRSTRAHNTVTVDGFDQAEQSSAFMWTGAEEAELVASSNDPARTWLLARHHGYRRRGITHWRAVWLDNEAGFVIWDLLSGDGDREHGFELVWQLDARVVASQHNGEFLAERDGLVMRMRMSGVQTVSIHRGEDASCGGGWVAPRYGQRKAAPVIRGVARAAPGHEFVTRIAVQPGAAFDEVHVAAQLDEWKTIAARTMERR